MYVKFILPCYCNNCNLHYFNECLSQSVCHLHMVVVQGVLEAIRISCAGYPTKRTFDEFIDRFGMLAPELVDRYNALAVEFK